MVYYGKLYKIVFAIITPGGSMDVIEDTGEYTKYEVARILGARALQLAMGAPPLVRPRGTKSPIELATKEFEKGVIPITVVRG